MVPKLKKVIYSKNNITGNKNKIENFFVPHFGTTFNAHERFTFIFLGLMLGIFFFWGDDPLLFLIVI